MDILLVHLDCVLVYLCLFTYLFKHFMICRLLLLQIITLEHVLLANLPCRRMYALSMPTSIQIYTAAKLMYWFVCFVGIVSNVKAVNFRQNIKLLQGSLEKTFDKPYLCDVIIYLICFYVLFI